MTSPAPSSPSSAGIQVFEANLADLRHQRAVLALIDAYSTDDLGDGKPLDPEVRARLIPGLRNHPTTLVFLAFDADMPVGVAVCFLGFSTFAAKPLINIHDFFVQRSHRARGVGRQLLHAVEAKARVLGCCKLTLEVLENNTRALRLYAAVGFARYQLQEAAGGAIFMAKPL